MIIIINGPFGIGKTTVADLLSQKLENSMVYNTEEVGIMIRKITEGIRYEDENTDDFQDIELWRSLIVFTAEKLINKYQRDLIVPITLYNYNYFKEIINQLQKIDNPIYHFCLTSSLETLYKKLEERGEKKGHWAWQKAPVCNKVFQIPVFEEKINTENKTMEDVAKIIFEKIKDD